MKATTYPFTPKSNRYLKAGQFFAVPLSDGRFAAGRVMVPEAFHNTMGLVVGLMDWVCSKPPTSEDLAGRIVLAQASTNIRAISRTGGTVLGERPLELDGLVPDPVSGLGMTHRNWGWATICVEAERIFVGPDSESICWKPG